MTPSGIEPATFRFVVQCLNHCATASPLYVHNVKHNGMAHVKVNRNQFCVVNFFYTKTFTGSKYVGLRADGSLIDGSQINRFVLSSFSSLEFYQFLSLSCMVTKRLYLIVQN
jgi:hypothetical protein